MFIHFLAASGFEYAFEQSSTSGIAVCVALGVLSVISWSVMVTKFITLTKAAKENRRFLEAFREATGPLDPFENQITPKGAPLFSVYAAGCRELCIHLLGSAERDELFGSRVRSAERVTPSQMDGVRSSMERAVGEMALRLESRMNFLATAVSGAPFLGLLGTVWGVMDTFSGIADAGGGASLAEMAPGVSAALVTTVIGLLVAIPAMFGYNYLINNVKSMVLSLDHYAAELQTRFERRYVDYGRKLDTAIALNAPDPTDIPPRPHSEPGMELEPSLDPANPEPNTPEKSAEPNDEPAPLKESKPEIEPDSLFPLSDDDPDDDDLRVPDDILDLRAKDDNSPPPSSGNQFRSPFKR